MVGAVAALAASTSAHAQEPARSVDCEAHFTRRDPVTPYPGTGSGRFRSYALTRLPPAEVERLREALRDGCHVEALKRYFREEARPDLLDWVVYIARDGTVTQSLVDGAGRVPRNEVRAQQYVWAIVFSDADLEATENGTADSTDLRLSRRLTGYRRDPIVSTLFRAAAGLISDASVAEPPAALPDSSRWLAFEEVSTDPSIASLHVAQGRFGLSENSTIVLSVTPAPGKELPPPVRSVYANFGNASTGVWDLALGIGTRWGDRVDVIETVDDAPAVTGSRPGTSAALYLFGTYNFAFYRPKLPWAPRSLGLTVGTNLSGSAFEELAAGVGLGRVVGSGGLVLGVSGKPMPALVDGQRVERRRWRPFVALDFRL